MNLNLLSVILKLNSYIIFICVCINWIVGRIRWQQRLHHSWWGWLLFGIIGIVCGTCCNSLDHRPKVVVVVHLRSMPIVAVFIIWWTIYGNWCWTLDKDGLWFWTANNCIFFHRFINFIIFWSTRQEWWSPIVKIIWVSVIFQVHTRTGSGSFRIRVI